MSDDQFLGKALFCIPRRAFVILVASWTFFGAIVAAVYVVFIKWMLHGHSMTPQHCTGHVCQQVATCVGLASGTYEVQRAVTLMGGIGVGYFGLAGAVNSSPSELQVFGAFLLFKAGMVAAFSLLDAGYYLACDAYPYNAVASSVLFPWPNWPMSEEQKVKISEGARWFPDGFMNDPIHENTIWPLCAAIIVVELAFLVYSAKQVSYLAEHSTYGVFGLGANFEIRQWRENKMFKDRVNAWIEYAKDDVRTTFREDLGGRAYSSVA